MHLSIYYACMFYKLIVQIKDVVSLFVYFDIYSFLIFPTFLTKIYSDPGGITRTK